MQPLSAVSTGLAISVVVAIEQGKRGDAPFPAALQHRVDAWSEWSKPRIQLLRLKIRLICRPRVGDISDIKLIRTDTTLDLSQKAEKRWGPKVFSARAGSRYQVTGGGASLRTARKKGRGLSTSLTVLRCSLFFLLLFFPAQLAL